MTRRIVPREPLLARWIRPKLNLLAANADVLKRIAHVWFGAQAHRMPKQRCIDALEQVAEDREQVQKKYASLSKKHRDILGVLKLHGGTMSGFLLLLECLARGLIEVRDERHGWGTKDDDPVRELGRMLLVVTSSGPVYGADQYYHYSRGDTYPELSLLPALRDLVEPVEPLTWHVPSPAPAPSTTVRRAPAEAALELWLVAQSLAELKSWKTTKGGSLAKSVQNRVNKSLAVKGDDPFLPPDPGSLYYEVLRGLEAVKLEADSGWIDLPAVEWHLEQGDVLRSWHVVRAWLASVLWQDGIGVVPDRVSGSISARIEPDKLHQARESLVWVLSRIARGSDDWLDLQTFLDDFWAASQHGYHSMYRSNYTWTPPFLSGQDAYKIEDHGERQKGLWLQKNGCFLANALMVTLVHLGLVERGQSGSGNKVRFCFRLTPLGKAVFAAPNRVADSGLDPDPRFLTVQPNFDVLAYLDSVETSDVCKLARMARRGSAAGHHVQTFSLTR